jgi:hypothetical protein
MFRFPRRQMDANMVWHLLVADAQNIRLPCQTEAYIRYYFSPEWSQFV